MATIFMLAILSESSTLARSSDSRGWPTTILSNSSSFCATIWSNDVKFSVNSSVPFQFKSRKIIEELCEKHEKSKNFIQCRLFHVKWLSYFQSVCINSIDVDTTVVLPFKLTTDDSLAKRSMDFKSKIIIFDYYQTPQWYLLYLFEKYPKMRDYHSDPPLYGPMIVGCKIIADTLNVTLVAKPDAEIVGLNLDLFPIINPAVQLYDAKGISVEMFWKNHRFSEDGVESAQLTQLTFLGYNFGYCTLPSVKLEKSWNLKILLNAFDFYIWLNLLISITLIATVLHVGAGFRMEWKRLRFLLIFHSVTIALISIGPSIGGCSQFLRKSGLFVMWMFMCIVFVNYYSGSITSQLISPPEEDKMTTLSHVVKRNYSPIFNDYYHIQIVKDTVAKYSSDGKSLGVLKEILNMNKIMDRTKNNSFIFNRTDYIRTLAYGKKTVIFYMWPYVIRDIDETNRLIADEEPVAFKRRRCYLGKYVLDAGQVYFGIGPPGSERLKNVFQVMFQTGIYSYWIQEVCYIMFAKRVQDRNKVLSPTHIKNDFDSEVNPLQMEGKVLTVFFLWGVCLVGCVLFYGVELVSYRKIRLSTSTQRIF
ncbi:unnamed protein product [Orchesella dallaii]|uniref:Uncharacterized protein n=1 Tax=Orchesella dallaii TaxID=48710 RepID=A0ABP1Q395_9HEXA